MNLAEFTPENPLEIALQDAKNGRLPISKLMRKIVESDLYVSSKSEVLENGDGFQPLLVGDNAHPLVSVFSSLSKTSLHRELAEFALQMKGRDLFRRLPANHGVALNPGYAAQLIISHDVISKLTDST